MRRNLKVGAIMTILAIIAVRLMTWINPGKLDQVWMLVLRISLIVTMLVGLIGGVILLIGIMQWMRVKSGL